MRAKYIDLTKQQDDSVFKEIGLAIHDGKLVVFPTETVYGIGTNALKEDSVKKIYKAKGRDSDNPLILHICDKTMLNELTMNRTFVENKLIDTYFPGPFTLILNRKSIVPNVVTANLDTVAIRMPSHPIAQKIIKYAGIPIAAPSANISGKPSGTIISDIIEELGDKVDYILDGGPCSIGLESTVVRVINEIPIILRPGGITKEDLQKTIGHVYLDDHLFNKCQSGEKVLSPGMKHRHYAPNTRCLLIYSDNNDKLIDYINELLLKNPHSLVISSTENYHAYHSNFVLDVGSKMNLAQISKNMFSTLRKVDDYPVNLVIIEGVSKNGIGLAIMNRLIRACEYNYIDIDKLELEKENL